MLIGVMLFILKDKDSEVYWKNGIQKAFENICVNKIIMNLMTLFLQDVGFEPTHIIVAGLKSAALDHSANLA